MDEEAIQIFDTIIKMNHSNHEAFNCKGNALRNLRKYNLSMEAYNEAINL